MKKLHTAADSIEPRFARAFKKSMATLRKRLNKPALQRAIASKNLKLAKQLIKDLDVEDALKPVADMVKDIIVKGGKIAVGDL